MLTKDFPISFEEQLRQSCPALFDFCEEEENPILQPTPTATPILPDKTNVLSQINDRLNRLEAADLAKVLQLVDYIIDNKPST